MFALAPVPKTKKTGPVVVASTRQTISRSVGSLRGVPKTKCQTPVYVLVVFTYSKFTALQLGCAGCERSKQDSRSPVDEYLNHSNYSQGGLGRKVILKC